LDAAVRYYELMLEGSKSLLAERDTLCNHATDLESELADARASVDEAAAGEKCLVDFEKELIKDMVDVRMLYEHNVQSIGGLCSPMPEGELSIADDIHWLTTEVTGLSEVFASVNENFVSAAVEDTLIMAGDFIDLAVL
jgi:hypothetical protein